MNKCLPSTYIIQLICPLAEKICLLWLTNSVELHAQCPRLVSPLTQHPGPILSLYVCPIPINVSSEYHSHILVFPLCCCACDVHWKCLNNAFPLIYLYAQSWHIFYQKFKSKNHKKPHIIIHDILKYIVYFRYEFSNLSKSHPAIIWLEYCWYSVKPKTINQSKSHLLIFQLYFMNYLSIQYQQLWFELHLFLFLASFPLQISNTLRSGTLQSLWWWDSASDHWPLCTEGAPGKAARARLWCGG